MAAVNVAAIERNCARLAGGLRSGSELCVVVKADGYGHGAQATARAALSGGASWLAVATAAEAAELRAGGVQARLLVMGALTPEELGIALGANADVVAWCDGFVDAVVARCGPGARARVHVKLDSGMGRLGTRDPTEADRVAQAIADAPGLELAGAMTHFATADELGDAFFAEQLERFTAWARALKAAHPALVVHAANSAATLRDPASHFDLVRAGVAVYGLDPFQQDPDRHGLEPALELCSHVAAHKPCAPGQSAGYGRRFIAQRTTVLGVLPVGYADGVRRALTDNAEVLVDGSRRPLVGTVSMDNITIDLGSEPATIGAEAVLIGARAGQRILAEDWARHLDTINYEVTCAIGPRVPRWHHRDGR